MPDSPNRHGSEMTLRARVRGRVQGVGFRWFVQQHAERLNLSGFVRNCHDGSVEAEASGKRAALEQLLVELRKGPPGAHVTSAAVEWLEGALHDRSSRFQTRA